MSGPIDRRAFLGGATAAGAVAAAAAAPLTARAFALVPVPDAPSSEIPSAAGLCASAADTDWHIDDMWGHTPRYAHPIPHSPMRTSPVAWEHIDPIDRLLVI